MKKIAHLVDRRIPILTWFRNFQLERDYRRRREFYARKTVARDRGRNGNITYHANQVSQNVQDHMAKRGYFPARRSFGEVHTLAYIPLIGWHSSLLPDLHEIGPVTHYDYVARGFDLNLLLKGGPAADSMHKALAKDGWEFISAAHKKKPLDWIFIYANGVDVSCELLGRVRDELGVPTVNMCLDDKQSWEGPIINDQHSGQVDICRYFDLSWTSARVACEWYLAEGARPIYMPEGYCQKSFHSLEIKKDIPVSFIGACYGIRSSLIKFLRKFEIPVQAFGKGWGGGYISQADQLAIMNRSVINLGIGGIGYSENLTNVKGRDFEIPACGGGMYLTTFNPDLAQHFEVGKEIACYRNRDELVELIRYYLARPQEAEDMAKLAERRCQQQHRWLHRYCQILQTLAVLEENNILRC